jgi:hypothetical protein
MPVAIVPAPWRRQQPLGRVEIDWNNALSQGLLRLWNFAQPLSVSELVKGPAAYTVVGSLTPEATHFGLGLFKPNAAYATTDDDYRTEITSQLTWFLDFELANATNNSFLIGNAQVNGVGYNSGLYVTGSGKPLFFVRNTGGTAASATGTTTLVADVRYQMVGTYDGANIRIYLNGLLEATQAQTGSVQQTDYDTVLNRWNSASSLLVRYVLGGVAKRVWSPGDVLDYRRNPWQQLRQRHLRVFFPAGTGITGTVAATEAADTLAASGQVLISGTVAATEANDTLAASGSVIVTGTVAATESADTLAATGAVLVSGTLAATEENDTLAASGLVSSGVAGTVAATEANDTLAATGGVLIAGTLAATEENDTLAASGELVLPITGTVAATEENDVLAASGLVLEIIVGTVAATEANDTMAAVGSNGVTGTPGDWTVTDAALYRWTLTETTRP